MQPFTELNHNDANIHIDINSYRREYEHFLVIRRIQALGDRVMGERLSIEKN